MLKNVLGVLILLSPLAGRADEPSVVAMSDAPTSPTRAEAPGPAPIFLTSNSPTDLRRIENEYLDTKNSGFSKWRDADVTAVGLLLNAIAERFAAALSAQQSLKVSGLATRTNIPGWGKPMEVSAKSFVELSDENEVKIICQLDTNLGYFFFPALINVECLKLGSRERLQISALATSSQTPSSTDPSELSGIDSQKLEVKLPETM